MLGVRLSWQSSLLKIEKSELSTSKNKGMGADAYYEVGDLSQPLTPPLLPSVFPASP